MKISALSLALAAAVAVPSVAAAQTSSRVVPPDRADQNPKASPSRAPGMAPAPPAPARDQTPVTPFTLRTVEVTGSSLPAERINAVTAGFTGKTVDGDGVNRVADAVAALYENGPVVLYTVQVPAQDFANGVLRLHAVEGHIVQVAVQGDVAGRDLSLLKRYIAKLTAETPLTRATWERYLTLIRDIPELNAEANLVELSDAGDVRLDLTIHPRRFGVGAAINNRGTALLGRTQAQVDVYGFSLFSQGDVLQGTVALPTVVERFQYYAAAYSTPVGGEGTTIAANIGYLRTKPDSIALRGHATSGGVQVTHPLLRSFTDGAYFSLGVDGVNSDNALFGQNLSNDRSRAARASLSFARDRSDMFFGASIALSAGIDGLGARTLNPAGTDLGFKKVNGRVGFNTRIGKPFVLRLVAAGQYTGDLLPSSEQFALGGAQFGRGYEAAVISGDNALAGSAELAWRPQSGLPQTLSGSEVYGFVDKGKVWYKGRYGFADSRLDLASAGGGVRILFKARHQLEVEATHTLPNSNPYLDRNDTRVVFSLRTFL